MRQVMIGADILEANEQMAGHNRGHFKEHGVYVVNLMSAPGAGKTSVLEQTINRIKDDRRLGVIEGDLMTTIDADRISALGVPSYQITTGTVCHLDAKMVHSALHSFKIGVHRRCSPDHEVRSAGRNGTGILARWRQYG